ncbi:MAG: hypothetical protein AAB632_03500 [Patescibacteria group bacterium]
MKKDPLSLIYRDEIEWETLIAEKQLGCDECGGSIQGEDVYHYYFYEEGDPDFSNDFYCKGWVLCTSCARIWKILENWGWEMFEEPLGACVEKYNYSVLPYGLIRFPASTSVNLCQSRLFDSIPFLRENVVDFSREYVRSMWNGSWV